MKKFILSVLAIGLCAGTVVAQELTKEQQKAIKEQQKVISSFLKDAEKAAKLPEDAMGQIDMEKAKAINFDAARQLVEQAIANPQSASMLGDIKRIAALIEYNQSKVVLPEAQNSDQNALNTLFSNLLHLMPRVRSTPSSTMTWLPRLTSSSRCRMVSLTAVSLLTTRRIGPMLPSSSSSLLVAPSLR